MTENAQKIIRMCLYKLIVPICLVFQLSIFVSDWLLFAVVLVFLIVGVPSYFGNVFCRRITCGCIRIHCHTHI